MAQNKLITRVSLLYALSFDFSTLHLHIEGFQFAQICEYCSLTSFDTQAQSQKKKPENIMVY